MYTIRYALAGRINAGADQTDRLEKHTEERATLDEALSRARQLVHTIRPGGMISVEQTATADAGFMDLLDTPTIAYASRRLSGIWFQMPEGADLLPAMEHELMRLAAADPAFEAEYEKGRQATCQTGKA